MSDTYLGTYQGLRTASILRVCVYDTTSLSSLKGYSSVHHAQGQTCVVRCSKNLFNKFNSFQTVTVQQKFCRRRPASWASKDFSSFFFIIIYSVHLILSVSPDVILCG